HGVRAASGAAGEGQRGSRDARAGGTVGVLLPLCSAGIRGRFGCVERARAGGVAARGEQLSFEREGGREVRVARVRFELSDDGAGYGDSARRCAPGGSFSLSMPPGANATSWAE